MTEKIILKLKTQSSKPYAPPSSQSNNFHYGFISSLKEFDNIDDLVKQLARICIDCNQYRSGERNEDFYYFTHDDVDIINKNYIHADKGEFNGGYMYLDTPNNTEGIIRIYSGDCNPKWYFYIDPIENNKILIDYA